MNRKNLRTILVFALAIILLSTAGCATRKRSNPSMDPSGLDGAMPQISSFADDIRDIPIPAELKWQRNDSMAIKTESFRGGVLVYTGNASILSLRDYMVAAMRVYQWRMVGETSSKDIMLGFVKRSKTCMMILSDSFFKKTKLHMYIAIDNASTGNVNPFGEVIPQ